jgi:hypothetical protein
MRESDASTSVMAALDAAIHAAPTARGVVVTRQGSGVDGRLKAGHDAFPCGADRWR